MSAVSIAGMSKAVVLAALYNASRPQGLGFMAYDPEPMSRDDAAEAEGICHVPLPGRAADVWWFGFDCAHSGDLSPGTRGGFGDHEAYRDVRYVRGECARLAQQLAAEAARP